jgi:tRNA-dihydrouridine synthase B
MFCWNTAKKPLVALAPMAGVTDASYRQCIKGLAPEVIVFTEFLSSDALHFGSEKTLKMLQFDPSLERPFIVQVFGSNRDHFISTCKIIEEIGADGIDINMGCPAARVVSSCHGSALIRKVELAQDLVAAAASAVKIPVSVKTRLGWDTAESLIPFCQKLVEAGAAALSIHGRTYKQKFSGEADWQPIYELKKHMSVPVLGNGDISSVEDAMEKIGNLDGVMIGRGTMGNPWLMKDVSDALKRHSSIDPNHLSSDEQRVTSDVGLTFEEKIPFILKHCELAVRCKGEKRGIIEMRKHFAGYVKGFEGAKEMRMRLMGTESFLDVTRVLTNQAAS